MAEIIYNLLEFFGLASVPTNLAEFLPWFVVVMSGLGLFKMILALIFAEVRIFGGFKL
ncbi:hypothetical protein [Jeotgalibaca porci]|uniref:hypothetical protein n=1 Tax=Jeotgalibaca porci TaxID=1868793 RepID=UPI0035A18460